MARKTIRKAVAAHKATRVAKKKVAVKKVKLPVAGAVRIVAPPDHHPVIVHKEPGIVEVVPVHREVVEEQSWFQSLFGPRREY